MHSTMNNSDIFLYLLLAIPFFTSMLSFCSIFLVKNKRFAVNIINIIGVTALLITAIATLCEIYYNGKIFGAGKWLYLDSLSGLFLLTLSVLAFITGLYSYGYMNEELAEGKISEKGLCSYFGFFHLFLFSMLIVITTNNLILMWAGIEATTLSSVFLVGFYGKKSSLEAAWKYIIICTVGVAFGLYGVVLVYSSAVQSMITAGVDPSDAVFWTNIMEHRVVFDQTLMHIAFVFILIGFGTKAGLFPMHAWLPDAHSESPSPASALLSAVLLKCAFLVILRYYIVINRSIDSTLSQNLLLAFGLASMAIAAFFFLMQKDIKRKLAYSSVENMGIIAVGIGFGGPIGVFAALIHVLNHSLVKGLLFCISGNVLLKYGTRDIRHVKGMLKAMPLSGVLLAAGALGLAGLPPFNIFISEFLVVLAGIERGYPFLVFFMLMILMVVLAGLVSLVGNCLFGQVPKEIVKGDLGIMTLLPMSALLVLMIIMGTCIPKPVTKMLASATAIVLDGKDNVSLSHIKPDLHSLLLPSNVEASQTAQSMLSEEKK